MAVVYEYTNSNDFMYPEDTDLKADMPRKESALERELNSLSRATSNLAKEAEELNQVLQPIMLEVSEKSAGDAGTPEESLSPVASEVRRQRYSVDQVAHLIRTIRERSQV